MEIPPWLWLYGPPGVGKSATGYEVFSRLAGQGHGRWLLAEALRRAWTERVERVRVHTCTLDHPAALSAYRPRSAQFEGGSLNVLFEKVEDGRAAD